MTRYSVQPRAQATDALKSTSQGSIQKTGKATGDLIGNKIADKITRVSEISPKSDSEMNKEEILREKYISPKLGEKIDDLRLKDFSFN